MSGEELEEERNKKKNEWGRREGLDLVKKKGKVERKNG